MVRERMTLIFELGDREPSEEVLIWTQPAHGDLSRRDVVE